MSFRPLLHANLWRCLKAGKRPPGSMSRISSRILENVSSANRLGLGGPSVKSSLAPLGSLPARCWFCDGLLTWPSPPLPAWPRQIPNPHKLFGFRIFGFWGKILDFWHRLCFAEDISMSRQLGLADFPGIVLCRRSLVSGWRASLRRSTVQMFVFLKAPAFGLCVQGITQELSRSLVTLMPVESAHI